MKKSFYFSILLIVIAGLGTYFYYNQAEWIPEKIAESRERILSVDKIRFALKVSILTQKGLASYCYALEKNDPKSLEESLNYFNAAYAFTTVEYTKNQELIKYVKPMLSESINIVEINGLDINDTELERLKVLASEISNKSGNIEQNTWQKIQDDYIDFQTKECKSKIILQVTLVFVIVLILLIVFLFYRITINGKQAVDKLQKLIDNQQDIVIVTNGDTLLFANKVFFDFFGFDSIDQFREVYGCICNRFIKDRHFFNLDKVQSSEAHWVISLLNLTGRERIVSMEDRFHHVYAFSVSISMYDQNSYIVNFHDVNDVMTEKLNLIRQAMHDNLTKAYNRTYFENNITRLIEQNLKDSKDSGIIIIDIDHFKEVNDTFGHHAGDEILIEVVELIHKNSRETDKLIRWGGEEFMIILPAKSLEDVAKQAEHLRLKIEQHVFRQTQRLTCSFGCALHTKQTKVDEVIDLADQNLYYAKQNGRNRVKA
jgi:diguanylate cyclase (GGDEF)-like protein